MPDNEWSNAAAQAQGATATVTAAPPPAPVNEWSNAAAQAQGADIDATNGQVTNTLQSAVQVNPDKEAEHRILADKTGIPVETVRNDPDSARQQVTMQQASSDRLAQRYPNTAKFMASIDNATLAHDDIANLTAAEGLVNPGLFSLPPLSMGQRLLQWRDDAFGVSDADKARSYVRSTAALEGTTPDALKRDVFNAPSEIPQQFASGIAQGATAGLLPNFSGDANTAWGSVAQGAGNLTGFLVGAPVQATNYALAKTGLYAIEGTGEAAKAVGTFAPKATDSFAKSLVRAVAHQSTLLSTANVIGGLGEDLNSPDLQTAGGKVAGQVGSGIEMGGVFGAAGKVLPDTNLIQGAIRAVGVNAALDALNGTSPDDNRSIQQKIFDYGLNTWFAAHGAGRTQGGWLHDSAKAETAQQDAQILANLNTVATQSKLRQRSPATFENFMADATAGGPVENLYLSPASLAQSGIDPAKLAELSPSAAAQLNVATQTGTDIRIPTSEFAAHLAGTDVGNALLQHVKTDPDGFSQAEAADFQANQGERLRQEVEQVLAEKAGDDEFKSSRDVVYNDLVRQLNDANRFTPDVNNTYAVPVADLYATMAARTGMTPEDFYKRYPLNINAEMPGGRSRKKDSLNGGLAQFGGLESKTSDLDKYFEAEDRLRTGDSPEKVRQETGWMKGIDGQMKYEISDADAKLRPARDLARDTIDLNKDGQTHPLGRVLEHERLFAAYPDLAGVKLKIDSKLPGRGSYSAKENTITVKPVGDAPNAHKQLVSTLLHEIQHVIQKREGFARGSNPDRAVEDLIKQRGGLPNREVVAQARQLDQLSEGMDGTPEEAAEAFKPDAGTEWHTAAIAMAKDSDALTEAEDTLRIADDAEYAYAANAGEIEARNTQKRQDMSDLNRKVISPQDTEDVDRRKAVVVFSDGATVDAPRSLYQGEFNRGMFTPGTDTLTLLKNADLSTFLHETGHFMLDLLNKVSVGKHGTPDIRADMDAVLKSFDLKGDTPEARLESWNAMTLDQQRENHETFARSFEAYLFSGKAPSVGLRQVFQRFRAWLLNVYRNLSALNVELSPDVKGVFDRMLATNDQIREHEALQAYAPLFTAPEDGGFTPEEYRNYHELGVQATQDAQTALESRSLRDMKWLSNAKGRELKRLQRDAEYKRKAMRAEVADEVNAEPVYRAMNFFKRGMLDLGDGSEPIEHTGEASSKLSLPALKEKYGDGPDAAWRKLGFGKYGMVAEDGIHPDSAAELFGFTSGDQLVKALTGADNPRDKINALTDWRMLERYGDLTDPATIDRAANEAIHNEARTKFIATEMNALQKAIGAPKILAKAAKGFAEQMVNRQRVRDLKPSQYTNSEARAARAADAARKAGDLPKAATEKRNQLINNYASKAAYDAQDAVEKGLRYLNKFNRAGTRSSIDPDYLDQIDAVLERFDLRRGQSLKAIDKRKSLLDWVASQREQGLEPNIPADLINEANRMSYKDMSVESFDGLLDTVRQIDHLGRLKERLLTAQDERNFGAARERIVNSVLDNAPKKNIDLRTRSNAGGEILKGLNRFLSIHRKMASVAREMDGFKDGGAMWDYFIRPMNEAGDRESTMRADATAQLHDMVKPLLEEGRMGGRGDYFPEVGMSLNREERISIALNVGNAGNIQRLLDGEGWKMEQVRPVLDSLNESDWKFVQGVWDYFETYRPLIAAKERRVYGVEPEWIEPQAVQTKFGELRGGYYPVKYDPARSGRAQEHADAEDAKNMLRGAYTSSTTRRSFTKARADEVTGRPLMYSFAGLFNGVTEVIHDLSWHEWMIDANRLLRSKQIDSTIRNKYGAETVTLFKDAIRDIGQGDVGAQNAWEQGINQLRHGVTIAGLGWNFTTSLLQPLGLSQSMARIGPKWVASGVRQWLKSPFDVVQNIYDKSPMMKLRSQTMQREIAEIRNTISGVALENNYRIPTTDKVVSVPTLTGAVGKVVGADNAVKARDWVQASMFLTIQKMQLVADVPTWLGQYEKSIAAGESDARAVALADQAVIDSQGGGQIKDLAAIQRGGPLQKLFTTFYSYFNVVHNLGAEVTNRTDWKDPASVAFAARDYMLLYIVPSVLSTVILNALHGALSSTNDQDSLVKKMINDEISYMFGTMVGLRELTGAAQTVAGVQQYASGYSGPAGLRFFNEFYKFAQQAHQGDWDKAARKSTINTAGILFHLPSAQLNRTIDGTEALVQGQSHNPLAPLVGSQ